MRALILAAALALAGCASTYQLTVMPRDSGKLYSGVAQDAGKGEGRISITLADKTYSGTSVETTPTPQTAFNPPKSITASTGTPGTLYSLPELAKTSPSVKRLPISIRVVLESVLRNVDGKKVTEAHVKQLANWSPTGARTEEIPFVLARILLQDFTGIPLLADLAAMRSVAARVGKDPKVIEPLVPVALVVDHSVQIDHYGAPNVLDLNMKLEFSRNRERYQFMKWGMQALDTFKVVPPGIGIVHQANLEYLARGVFQKNGVYYPYTLDGTARHTTMINGLGVVAWGVGGIEAEAGMLGQPGHFPPPPLPPPHPNAN